MKDITVVASMQVLNEEQHIKAAENEYNFDHPDAFDYDLLVETLKKLKKGKQVDVSVHQNYFDS